MAELRAFVALSRSTTMSEAASVIGRDATALSRRLQSLETRLGVRLFRRNTRQVTLTDEGRLYLERVAPLIGAIDEADAEVGETAGRSVSGRIKITLPISFGRTWVTPILLSFLKQYPDVLIHVDFSDRNLDLVGGGYDLAIRIGALASSGLIARRIADRQRVICAAPDHAALSDVADPTDLSRHKALCLSGRERQQWIFENDVGGEASVTMPCVMSSNSADFLIEAACAGLGIVNTTDWHAHAALKEGRLVRLLEEWRQVDDGAIHLVMSNDNPPVRVRALAGWIVDRLTSARIGASG